MSLRRLRPPLFWGAPAAGELLMKERVDYVALSLLPINWWRDVAAEETALLSFCSSSRKYGGRINLTNEMRF